MFNLAFDFIIVLLFFIAFKFYGIYTATIVGIVTSAIQVILTRLWRKKFDKQQLFILAIFLLFGGMTLYFHNPIFIKWKPSILFWLFGLGFLATQFMGKQPLIQRMMMRAVEQEQHLPDGVWRKLNLAWAVFFLVLGSINIIVAYNFTTDTWVNFKLYGIFGAIFLFAIGQAIFLGKYLAQEKR